MTGLKHNTETGLIDGARLVLSPNHDHRPDSIKIDVLIIHAISLPPRCYGNQYVEHLFTNCLDSDAHPYFRDIAHRNLSSHFYIKREGELIQFVPTHRRAWHAGVSSFYGREQVNDFSIGIELEGCDDHEFEDAQYSMLLELTHCLQTAYPGIKSKNIVGHNEVSPGRKTDPGPCFDWERYLDSIAARGD